MTLVSYTVPCHKRANDLMATLPSVIAAAKEHPPVELVIADYGNDTPLSGLVAQLLEDTDAGVSVLVRWVDRDYFHMAHARNVGLRAASGDIVVAFLADQLVTPDFFKVIREQLEPGTFLKWFETFVFWRTDIVEAGGFDERFEFYGPEGKELTDRLQRRGLKVKPIPKQVVNQIPTPDHEKVKHYREKLSKHQMHARGMAIWEENRAAGITVANPSGDWGLCA